MNNANLWKSDLTDAVIDGTSLNNANVEGVNLLDIPKLFS
ncbi:MAG: pentapeptide repeat-containing protein [Pseudanabaena sp.]